MRKWFDFSGQNYQEQVNIKDYSEKLYFKNGYPVNQAFKRDPLALVSTLKWNTLGQNLLQEIFRFFNLWLLVLFILYVSFGAYDNMIVVLVQWTLNITIRMIRVHLLTLKVSEQIWRYYNQDVYLITWDPKCHIARRRKRDISVGDLIFFKRYQPVPITVLILNSQEERFMVQTWEKDGLSYLTPKRSLKLTALNSQEGQKQTFIYYKRILTGKIEFDPLKDSVKYFKGFIKLQKDPKGEYIDFSNIITQSSVILNTDWVVGIVITNDEDDLISLWNTLFFKNQNTDLANYFERYAMLFILFSVFSYLYGIMRILIFARIPVRLADSYTYTDLIGTIFRAQGMIQPAMILFATEFLFMVFSRKYADSEDISINDPQELLNLARTNLCIYDKTGTLTNANTILGGVIVCNKFFPVHEEKLVRKKTQMFKRVRTRNFTSQQIQGVDRQIEEQEDEEELPSQYHHQALPQEELQKSIQSPKSLQGISGNNKKGIQINELNLGVGMEELQDSEPNFPKASQIEVHQPSQSDCENAILQDDKKEDRNQIFHFNPKFLVSKPDQLLTTNKQFTEADTFENATPYNEPNAKFFTKKKDRSRGRSPNGRISYMDKAMKQIEEDNEQQINLQQSLGVPLSQSNIEQIEDEQGVQQLDVSEDVTRKDLRELIRLGNTQVNEFMRALILCQDIKTKSSRRATRMPRQAPQSLAQSVINEIPNNAATSNFIHENTEEYQESLIKYAKLYGFEFICSGELNKRICYEINAKGLSERYNIIKKIHNGDTFTILVERNAIHLHDGRRNRVNSKSAQVHVYVKCENMSLLETCKLPAAKRITIEKQIQYLQANGYRFVFYAGKSMDAKEDNNPQFLMKTDVSFNSTQQSSVSDHEMYDDLEFYGIACLKEQYNQGSQQIARDLQKLEITQWVLSADKKLHTLGTCYSVGILQDSHTILRIDEEDEEKLKLQIKSQLLYIRKQLLKETETNQLPDQQLREVLQQSQNLNRSVTDMSQPGNKKALYRKKSTIEESMIEIMKNRGEEPLQDVCLVVSGKSLRMILQDGYMRAHFLFIALILKTVVAYDCDPQDKAFLCREVSQVLQNHLMTVTDSVDDVKMNRYAQVNVQYLNTKGSVQLAYSHLMVSNLQHIRQFLLHFSKLISLNIRSQTIVIVKCTFTLAATLTALFQLTFNLHMNVQLIYQFMLLLQIFVPVCLICNLNDRATDEQLEILLPQIIPQFFRLLQHNWKWAQEFMFEVLLSSVITCVISSTLFRNFMLARTPANPYHRDIWTSNDLLFILLSAINCSLIIAHMRNLNVSLQRIGLAVLSILTFMVIGLAIGTIPQLRNVIFRQVFSVNFLLGLVTIMVMIIIQDQLLKELKIVLFRNKQVKAFLLFNERKFAYGTNNFANTVDHDNNIVLPPIKAFQPPPNIKISNVFFENLKRLFNNVIIDPFIRSLFETSSSELNSKSQNLLTLTFGDSAFEQKFRDERIFKYFQKQRLIVTVVLIGSQVAQFLQTELQDTYILVISILNWIGLGVWLILIVINKIRAPKNNRYLFKDYCLKYGRIELYFILPWLMIFLQLGRLILDVDSMKVFYYDALNQILQYQILTWDIFPPPVAYPSALIVLFQIAYAIRNLYNVQELYHSDTGGYELEERQIQIAVTIFIVFLMSLLTIVTHRDYERMHRLSFQSQWTIKIQQEQTNQILKLLLPAFIYEKIELDQTQIEENQGMVAIVFLEICHFDKILQSKQRQVVSFLDDIFRVFDKICLQYGVQKIETVGKTYMACSGLKSLEIENKKDGLNQRNETEIGLDISFEFFKSIQDFRFMFQGKQHKLKLKIGIHYGPVIAGVIGYHKPQFSLIGDTVNTASRMCSTGDEGRITISEAAYNRVLNTTYLFIEKKVYAKGKGELSTFQVGIRKLEQKRRVSLPANLANVHIENVGVSSHFTRVTRVGAQSGSIGHEQQPRVRANMSQRRSRVFSQKHPSNAVLIPRKPGRFDRGTEGPNPLNRSTHHHHQPPHICVEQDEVRKRARTTQNIQYTKEQQWNEEKEDEIKLQQVEWYPENRMIGHTSDGLVGPSLVQEQPDKTKQIQTLQYSRWNLSYEHLNEPAIIAQFEHFFTRVRNERQLFFMVVSIIFFIVQANVHLIDIDDQSEAQNYVIRLFITLLAIMLAFISTKTKRPSRQTIDRILSATFYTALSIQNYAICLSNEMIYLNIHALQGYIYSFAAVNQQAMKFKHMFTYLLVQTVAWVVVLGINNQQNTVAFIIVACVILMIISYNNFKLAIKDFNAQANETLKKEQKDSLLTNLLPSHILTRFYQNNKIKLELSDELKQATLLFADIAGFTAYSSSVSAEQVVAMLRQLMTAFDKECLQKNVYKVYTIGDCYVVLGINNMEQRHPGQEARNVLEMGLEMIEIIKNVRRIINFKGLNMRIGIHTGEFYGGILGTDIVRYDIFGVDAVIANKMESNGDSAKVMVSEDTKMLIDNHFPGEYKFEFSKEVEVPVAKRTVKAYFVTKDSAAQ